MPLVNPLTDFGRRDIGLAGGSIRCSAFKTGGRLDSPEGRDASPGGREAKPERKVVLSLDHLNSG